MFKFSQGGVVESVLISVRLPDKPTLWPIPGPHASDYQKRVNQYQLAIGEYTIGSGKVSVIIGQRDWLFGLENGLNVIYPALGDVTYVGYSGRYFGDYTERGHKLRFL